MSKKEMVTTANIGNLVNAGIDKKSPLLKKDDETYKVTFGDKDESKLTEQREIFNKSKKELGWNLTISPILNENNYKSFILYSYGVSITEIRSKLNKNASMEKFKDKKESILDKAINKITENKQNSKKVVSILVKESDLTILQNDYMNRPEEELESFNINDKVFVVEGPKRGSTGIIKEILGENVLLLLEDYRYYTYPYTILRKFVGIKSFGIDDKWGF